MGWVGGWSGWVEGIGGGGGRALWEGVGMEVGVRREGVESG